MIRVGRGTTEVALRLAVDPRSVRRWKAAYRRRGEAAIVARCAGGRPSKLTSRQRQALQRRLLEGAKANGFPTERWTCPRIAELIERRYGVIYHVDHLPRLLRSLGFSCQSSTRRAIRRGEQANARWVAKDRRRIKRKRRSKSGA